jgi:cobalt/nickel transport protein
MRTETRTVSSHFVSTRTLLAVLLLTALLLAGVVSYYASASPDGLNRVAGDLGFAATEQASRAGGGPLAGYEVAGLDSARLSGGLAGVLGCLVVLGCTSALMLARTRRPAPVEVIERSE